MFAYNADDLYCDKLYRTHSVLMLNIQAHRIFSDSIIVSKNHEMLEEINKMTSVQEPLNYDYPINDKIFKYYILENVKIALGLEIHLKSLLLFNDYLVHLVKNDILKNQQKIRPISIAEYINKCGNNFSPPYLRQESLKLSSFENLNYINALGLDNDIVDIIKHFRMLRNSVHLPINIPSGLPLDNEKIIKLVRYINLNIIDFSYKIADDYKFNHNFNLTKF